MKCPQCGNNVPNPNQLLDEYRAIENRLQNDSRVFYSVIVALLILTGSSFLAYLSYLQSFQGKEIFQILLGEWIIFGSLALLPLIFILSAVLIQSRIIRVGNIRIARAIEIEQHLDMRNFRLFHPWHVVDDNYFAILGLVSEPPAKGDPYKLPLYYEEIGKKYYEKTMHPRFRKVSRILQIATFTVILILVVLFGIFTFVK